MVLVETAGVNAPLADGADLFRHMQWSDVPDVSVFETGMLPFIAMRHHRTHATGTVEIVSRAPAAEGLDALFINRSGQGVLTADFCGNKHTVELHRDLCFFFPAGSDSRLQFGHQAGSLSLYFRPGVITSLFDADGKGDKFPEPIVGQKMPQVAHLMGLIEIELRHPSLGSRLMIDGLLRAIVGLLVSNEKLSNAEPRDRIYLSPAKLKRVIDFIEAHLQDSIGLENLAEAAGLSANHFLRVFKLATGETPYHFLRNRRLERARQLLADDDIPLAQLALECGFANQAHFTTAFSRELGISPGRYRRSVCR